MQEQHYCWGFFSRLLASECCVSLHAKKRLSPPRVFPQNTFLSSYFFCTHIPSLCIAPINCIYLSFYPCFLFVHTVSNFVKTLINYLLVLLQNEKKNDEKHCIQFLIFISVLFYLVFYYYFLYFVYKTLFVREEEKTVCSFASHFSFSRIDKRKLLLFSKQLIVNGEMVLR